MKENERYPRETFPNRSKFKKPNPAIERNLHRLRSSYAQDYILALSNEDFEKFMAGLVGEDGHVTAETTQHYLRRLRETK